MAGQKPKLGAEDFAPGLLRLLDRYVQGGVTAAAPLDASIGLPGSRRA